MVILDAINNLSFIIYKTGFKDFHFLAAVCPLISAVAHNSHTLPPLTV